MLEFIPHVLDTTPPPAVPFDERLERIARPLRALNEVQVRTRFGLLDNDTLIKTTISLCAECLAHVPAAVFERERRVLIRKTCLQHGQHEAVIENDVRFYRLSSKDRWGRAYADFARLDIPAFTGGCCAPAGTVPGTVPGTVSETVSRACSPAASAGAPPRETVSDTVPAVPGVPDTGCGDFADQQANKTCTVLVEITDACNLACRVCYSDSKGDRVLPVEAFKAHVGELLRRKVRLDSVQVTGGEASLHPDFFGIVEWLCAQDGVGKVYLPTNGLLFNKPGFADRLRPLRERILVLLQFDGRDEIVNSTLRNAKPQKQREKLIRTLDRLGIAMQLTMTLTHGVSEADIAWVVAQGLKHRNVRLVAMQPAFFSGRYELEAAAQARLTLSDCVKGVVAGMAGKAVTEDFMPIPCSHPNCGWVTLFARRFGLVRNIARHVDLEAVMNDVAYKTLLSKDEMQDIVGTRGPLLQRLAARIGRKLVRPQDVFGIAIKPFMDRYSYDQDRVSACCHHILDTHGNAVSFCEYNARLRAADSWKRFPGLEGP